MYQYERFNSWIKRRIHNRRYPEATVIQTYRLSEWAHFMELSGKFEKGTLAYIDCSEAEDEVSTLPELVRADFSLTGDIVELLQSHYSMKHGGCTDMSLEATLLHRYQYEDNYGRTVILGCAEAEKECSQSRSSYVSSMCGSECLCIGRIILFFRHTFVGVTSTFAYVSWFDGPHVDIDSKLNYIWCDTQTQSVVPVTELSKPLVIGYDGEELNKLWILNL